MRCLARLGAVFGAAVLVLSAAPTAFAHTPSPSTDTPSPGAMDPNMPGMTPDKHGAMTATPGGPSHGDQGTMDPNMPGMNHDVPAAPRPRAAVLGGFVAANASILVGGLVLRRRKR